MEITDNLSRHFKPDEIDILCSITLKQMQEEIREEVGNPYSAGMNAFLENNLTHPDPTFMEKARNVTLRYDVAVIDDATLRSALSDRVLGALNKR